MNDFSVAMALVDYIPVILFGYAAALLQRALYDKMTKASFALFAAGTINVFAAGFLKATWKLLYAAGICDFAALNEMFFPVQSIGFLLAGGGILLMLYKMNRVRNATLLAVPPVFSGTFVFVGLMVAGLGCMDGGLCYIASKMKKRGAVCLFMVSFVCSLCMGYLSSKDFAQAYMNWIAEIVNICGQGLFLAGVLALEKAGLKEFDWRK